jgi:LmbE family N-acetylglucosaminyl deacetylase
LKPKDPVDVLVFAPHPDDEVVGTGGVLQQAIAAGKTVRIVFVTNGDGYPRAASALLHKPIADLRQSDYLSLAATRQREAGVATEMLGVPAANLVFLGYPDAGLAAICAEGSGAEVASPFTGRTSTYGPRQTDYHTVAHGRPAPYTRGAAAADVEEILRDSQPAQVYMSDGRDDHPDHHATFALVRDAADSIRYGGSLFTSMVHSGRDEDWPWPHGATPSSPFQLHTSASATYPMHVPWPPPLRVPLTPGQAALKHQALAAHSSQWAIDSQYLESFVKSEEVFWLAGRTS